MAHDTPLQIGPKSLGSQPQQRLGWEREFPKFKGHYMFSNKDGWGDFDGLKDERPFFCFPSRQKGGRIATLNLKSTRPQFGSV